MRIHYFVKAAGKISTRSSTRTYSHAVISRHGHAVSWHGDKDSAQSAVTQAPGMDYTIEPTQVAMTARLAQLGRPAGSR